MGAGHTRETERIKEKMNICSRSERAGGREEAGNREKCKSRKSGRHGLRREIANNVRLTQSLVFNKTQMFIY